MKEVKKQIVILRLKMFILALSALFYTKTANGQIQVGDSIMIVRFEVIDGDTLPVFQYDEFVFKRLNSEEELRKFKKLKYNVKKVLPYAKLAAFRLQMLEDNLYLINTRAGRKKYIKETEKSIKEEFIDDLKNLTVSQGKLLLKLIHRETGKTTYEILKGYRGSATTFYWGTLAKFYDADIKDEFDPIEDYQIEYIIETYDLE